MAELEFRSATLLHGVQPVVQAASLRVGPGELTALIGPNGAGKTTLLRAALGLLRPAGGAVLLAGRDPAGMEAVARARLAAYLPQSRPLAWPLRVAQVVALGRFAHGAPRITGADAAPVARALAACRLEALAQRRTDQLSGGELARVHLARALAAEAPLLLADEPTAALDPRHALEAMAILRAFCDQGGGALVTLHDLSLAARFADRVIVLCEGRILADGPPVEAMASEVLAQAFGVRASLFPEGVAIAGLSP